MGGEKKKEALRVQLPEEIIVEILSKSPVKTLLRFRCVCKSWNSLISDANFKLSTAGRERAIVLCSLKGNSKKDIRSFYSLDDDRSILKLPFPICHLDYSRFTFLGSCNGLILFLSSGLMYLWNPLTRCCRELSEVVFVYPPLTCYGFASGLCYDKSSDDYKIVLITTSPPKIDDAWRYKSVNIVSLKKKERRTDISFPYEISFQNAMDSTSTSGVLVRGHLHWIMHEDEGDAQCIVYFDEKMNQFGKLPMPDGKRSAYYFALTVLDGCLCMSRNSLNKDIILDNDVLVMQEYGVKQSWTKLFTISGFLVPLHTRISDGGVVLVKRQDYLCTYHLRSQSTEMITFRLSRQQMTRDTYNNLGALADREIKLAYIGSGDGPLMYTESLESIPCL